MKILRLFYLCIALVLGENNVLAQTMITRTIKSFGAKGDGKTNDSYAFEKAATFFNKRGGYGKLIIDAGTYIVGKQVYNKKEKGKYYYTGKDILSFKNITNLTIEGKKGSIIKYADNLRFGSFDPETGKAYRKTNKDFYELTYAVNIGSCIYVEKCSNIKISGLLLNGNNTKTRFGGIWGDKGIQLHHMGVFIMNSKNVVVDKIIANYFALDGICVWNFSNDTTDNIQILNSAFEYNSRQGLSWIGGNHLYVKNSKFNHTGRGKYASAPSAGVDIEAAGTFVKNGVFENCEFVNNVGCGMVSDQGDNANCSFVNCIFWGVTSFSAWVKMPDFSFRDCKFYGPFVHGYKSTNDKDATKFFNCLFEDKLYKGKELYGAFLFEASDGTRMLIDSCTFVANKKKLVWIQLGDNAKEEDYYRMSNNTFIIKGAAYAKGDFIAVLRRIKFKGNTVQFLHPKAKELYSWPAPCCTKIIDMGDNKVIFK